MYRTGLDYLLSWLSLDDRLPLVIRGARQVGKTWLVRELATQSGRRLIELNFEDNQALQGLFDTHDPATVLVQIAEALNIERIDPQTSILFLDEIQVAPQLYAYLRWFAEKMPQLPVIAAGSLFEFLSDFHKGDMSMPVGRVEFMYLEPLSFEEFLVAKKQDSFVRLIKEFSWDRTVPEVTHNAMIDLVKEYTIVGGMPAAVKSWITSQDLSKVSKVHHRLLDTYKGDFEKYAGRNNPRLLENVLRSVPDTLGKKLMYSKVEGGNSAQVKAAFNLLCRARVCHRVIATAANGVPLAAERNEKFIKPLFLDVGLCSAMLNLSLHMIRSVSELSLVNTGGIAEQLVGQALRTSEPFYYDPQLYYWTRHDPGASAEVDYVIQHESNVVPIEVKAGTAGSMRSLHVFMERKKRTYAVRISSQVPSIQDIAVKLPTGVSVTYQLRTVPFYLVGQVQRLCCDEGSA